MLYIWVRLGRLVDSNEATAVHYVLQWNTEQYFSATFICHIFIWQEAEQWGKESLDL